MSLTTYPDTATAVVIAYSPPTRHGPATVVVACPYCRKHDRYRRPTAEPGEHRHGVGLTGQAAGLGSRVAHCSTGPRGVYVLDDRDGLVPSIVGAPVAVTA